MSKIAPIVVEEMHVYWKHGQNFHPYSRAAMTGCIDAVTFLCVINEQKYEIVDLNKSR